MNVYLIETRNMSPNAVRAGIEPSYHLQRRPGVTYMKGEPLDVGRLGITNDIYQGAHGAYDLATEDGRDSLMAALRRLDITTPLKSIIEWGAYPPGRIFHLKVRGEPSLAHERD